MTGTQARTMLSQTKPRGATAIRNQAPERPRGLYLLGGALFACLAGAVALLSIGDNPDAPQPHQIAAADVDLPVSATAAPTPVITPVTPRPPAPMPIEPAPPEQPRWDERQVKPGDTLSAIFKRAGFSDREVYEVLNHGPEGKALGRLYPGQVIAFQSGEAGELTAVRHVKSPLETTEYRRGPDGFHSQKLTREPEIRATWATGEITSSLFLAGQEAGLSQNLIMEMANIFGGVIDFILDPRVGDTMHLVYEELYLDGEKYRDGDIVAASFTNRGQTFNAYRYEDSNGEIGYFNEEGVSMRKAFLMAPVDFTRISSNFNLRRLHPIYKTTRPHRGTDYAAPRGTPVFAAGDGKVVRAGYSKANGNYVFIQHGQEYVTRYLHLHKRRVRQGQQVSQSQVIGTVGATGAATGPHLHYEFLVNGVHRNPRTIHKKLPKAKSLDAAELPRFRAAISGASTQLASLRNDTQVALNQLSSGSEGAAP